MSRLRWLVQGVVCAAFGFWITASSARAQTPAAAAGAGNTSEANSSEYDHLIAQAIGAYEGGRFAEARNSFRRAHDISPTAKTLRTIGMCSFNLGDYVDALLNLEAATVDTRKALTADQRAQVNDLIARSAVHVGRFKIRLSPPDAVLWADGRPPPQLTTGEVLLEPGRHELLAQASGHQPSRSTLSVDGGDRTTLEIVLVPSPAASDAALAAAPSSMSTTASPPGARSDAMTSTERGSRTQAALGYAALGLGGVGLVAFGVTAAIAASKQEDLDSHCADRACGPAYHDDVDTYDRYKLLSTVSLVTGLVFAGAGLTLLLTQPDSSRSEHAAITPVIGLGAIGVRGRL